MKSFTTLLLWLFKPLQNHFVIAHPKFPFFFLFFFYFPVGGGQPGVRVEQGVVRFAVRYLARME